MKKLKTNKIQIVIIAIMLNICITKHTQTSYDGLSCFVKKYPVSSALVAFSTLIATYKLWTNYTKFQELVTDSGDIFMVGERAFSRILPPAKMTREEWYITKMAEQEHYIQHKILKLLNVSPEEFRQYQNKATITVVADEAKLRSEQQDIRGTWIADYKTGQIRRPLSTDAADQKSFTITDADLAHVRQILNDFGYSHIEIIQSVEPSGEHAATAWHSCIQIYPIFFWNKIHTPIDQLLTLRHELSHIQHQDIIFDKSIMLIVQDLVNDDTKNFDPEKLKHKKITLHDLDLAHRLKMKINYTFHERRADLEGLMGIKNHPIFKDAIKDVPQYQGYPFLYTLNGKYHKESRINYFEDFLRGIKTDYKQTQVQ